MGGTGLSLSAITHCITIAASFIWLRFPAPVKPPRSPQRHLQSATAQPSASFRKLFKITCLKLSLKCHLDVTLAIRIGDNKGDLNCSFSDPHLVFGGSHRWGLSSMCTFIGRCEKKKKEQKKENKNNHYLSCIKHKNKTMTNTHWPQRNTSTEVARAGADSRLCSPAFLSIELKVSAWGRCMIERCDMETRAGSHCQRHGLHLTPRALSPWPPPTLAAREMAFSSQLALWHFQNSSEYMFSWRAYHNSYP